MKVRHAFVTFALAAFVAAPAWAALQTATLSIPGMTCGACPITVHKALERLPGVEKIAIDEAKKQVSVTFDDARTNLQVLTKATADAGYPSKVVGVAQ